MATIVIFAKADKFPNVQFPFAWPRQGNNLVFDNQISRNVELVMFDDDQKLPEQLTIDNAVESLLVVAHKSSKKHKEIDIPGQLRPARIETVTVCERFSHVEGDAIWDMIQLFVAGKSDALVARIRMQKLLDIYDQLASYCHIAAFNSSSDNRGQNEVEDMIKALIRQLPANAFQELNDEFKQEHPDYRAMISLVGNYAASLVE